MKLQMSSIKFDADVKLLEFIQKKADKLDTFFDRIIDGDVNLLIDNKDSQENKVVEMKINVPGASFFAKETSKSFEAATDLAAEALRRQLKKHKGKLIDRHQEI